MLRIFSPFKNATASAGFEPANLGTKGQHATPRPPKPKIINMLINYILIVVVPDPEARFSVRLHNTTLYHSATHHI